MSVESKPFAMVLPKSEQLYQSFRLSIPVAMAYVPLGIAFGVFLVTSGVPWYWAPLSALMIFAGSIEFLAVSLMVSGMALPQVALTALIVNFRHVFYGLSFPYPRLRTLAQRVYGVFALTDETYAITSAGEGAKLNGFQITALQLISHVWWVGGALLGSLTGLAIPSSIRGFGFALTSMFVILAVDAVRTKGTALLIGAAALASAAAFASEKWLYRESFLFAGLLVYLAILTLLYIYGAKERDE
ncbi:AzlC family ABC transporter permease [Burkholderia seminalis]|uniref:AzlC family ABC transporter permease n=1 Tax=Burkholderia seminalis TaxID=488731 RepID=UPI00264AD8C1|nr:AzlC family ABC transporter permease [Burkholderia seminalis]MDN7587969.1 AzlC family ABC transporter permease [Burkholderia seminalis]